MTPTRAAAATGAGLLAAVLAAGCAPAPQTRPAPASTGASASASPSALAQAQQVLTAVPDGDYSAQVTVDDGETTTFSYDRSGPLFRYGVDGPAGASVLISDGATVCTRDGSAGQASVPADAGADWQCTPDDAPLAADLGGQLASLAPENVRADQLSSGALGVDVADGPATAVLTARGSSGPTYQATYRLAEGTVTVEARDDASGLTLTATVHTQSRWAGARLPR